MTNFKTFVKENNLSKNRHQKRGVKWILKRETREECPQGIRGGLIADEMGLGKTIQILGAMYSNPVKRTLIVLPNALLEQWCKTIKGLLKTEPLLFHGPIVKNITKKMVKAHPIVVTTYGMVAQNNALLRKIKWSRAIFDEAHHLRNNQTKAHKYAVALKRKITWLMTGTPIQNKRSDFYALCKVLGLSENYYLKDENMSEISKCFILKRTLKEVGIELPQLHQHTTVVKWKSERELDFAKGLHSLLGFSGVSGTINSRSIVEQFNQCPLSTLLRARQMCIYPEMVQKKIEDMITKGIIPEENIDISSNSKINAVVEQIDGNRNGRCKLVFCHFRSEIDVLAKKLGEKNFSVCTFDGRCSAADREVIMQSSPDVLILQVQTCCEGLNLQQFKEVYFVSPHWNPAVEDQAVARSHRIGQTEDVHVYRFKMDSFDQDQDDMTIEDYASQLQKKKRELIDDLNYKCNN